ncbi:pilus assembly protein TadG-related protein [Streptomyces purpureus]|uniref:pilus assembly protein TadG-related protein n=1 Tax=Streptomyces purpureus TaxID=1951 RepID=UPI00036B0134|nr:pilus assembly protein TadG-related protein [Streptomyces purpureus]
MTSRRTGDTGQAFPIYITVVGGLLFLAFAYFAVGQAAATRSGAQTAADAAALAAAQDAREQLRDGWLAVILKPAEWEGFLSGWRFREYTACQEAASFADRNDAELLSGAAGCSRLPRWDGEEGFAVKVRTLGTVGESVIPGTENQHATASAKAVIEPRCTFEPPKPPAQPDPTEAPDPGEDDDADDDTNPDPKPILGLSCDGVPWDIDPTHPKLPSAADLFTVRLAD